MSMQAESIVRAIEIEIGGAKDMLATKQDLVLLRSDVRQEITLLRSETAELGTQLCSEMAELGTQLRGEMVALTMQLRGDMSEHAIRLGSGISVLRTELRAEIRTEIGAFASSITRQMYAAVLGQMAVLLGIAYFFVTHIAVS